MAKEQKGSSAPEGGRKLAPNEPGAPDTRIGGDPTTSIMMGDLGQRKGKARTKNEQATQANLDRDGVTVKTGLGDNDDDHEDNLPEEDGEDTSREDQDDDGQTGEDEEGQEEDEGGEELDPFDPEDDQVVEAYDKAYMNEDGSPNLDKLSAEWFANVKEGQQGHLNEDTYKYLEDKYGLTREQIKDLEAGQVARQDSAVNAIAQRAGGKERLDAALKWGAEGGYTETQRARFNRAMQSGDPEEVAEAVDALMARYDQANGTNRRQPRHRRQVRPGRDATTKARRSSVEGYASYAEYQKEAREARASGDMQKLELTRRRLRASPWFGSNS